MAIILPDSPPPPRNGFRARFRNGLDRALAPARRFGASVAQSSASWWRKYDSHTVLTLFGLAFLVVYLSSRIFYRIESGHAGVYYRLFHGGTVTESVRDEGLQIIPPWNNLFVYDTRLQRMASSFAVLSTNGLKINVEVSIRFRPKIELLGVLHKDVGTNYADVIVVPEIQALIRAIFGRYTPEEIYTTKRSLIQNMLQEALTQIQERYVVLDDVLITSIGLPEGLEAAIEGKLIAQQRSLEMVFRIEREEQEARRKVIEATGIDLYHEILNQSLTDRLLTYEGILATVKLAESTNAKLVVIGGKNGLPIILDANFGEQAGPALTESTNSLYEAVKRDLLTRPFRVTNPPPAILSK